MELRAPRPDDASGVASLVNDLTEDWLDWPRTSAEEVRAFWGPRPELQAVLAVDDGRLVGYGRLHTTDPNRSQLWLEAWTYPGDDDGVEASLVRVLEQRAERRAAGGDVVLRSLVESRQTGLRSVLAGAGFGVMRRPVRMLADLEREPARAEWPNGVQVRTFRPGDERAVYDLHMETLGDAFDFQRDRYEDWLAASVKAESFDPGLWFLVEAADGLVGMALCHVSRSDPTLAWFDMLGVRRDWRGRGLGVSLTRLLLEEYRRRGLRQVGCATDADNPTGASRVAGVAGFRVVQEFETFEKRLHRDGPARGILARSSSTLRRRLVR